MRPHATLRAEAVELETFFIVRCSREDTLLQHLDWFHLIGSMCRRVQHAMMANQPEQPKQMTLVEKKQAQWAAERANAATGFRN